MPDESAVADFALAALCHDLGHGPLSHAWEREVIGESFDRGRWAFTLGLDDDNEVVRHGKWHELVGQALLAWEEGQLHKVLENHEIGTSERIRRMLSGEYYLSYFPRLLSSDVDVDRADFVMRDTHHTGVAYGRFDLDWLISTCTFGCRARDPRRWVIGFDRRKALRVVEQFLIARRALYETVYQHKTVRCIEGMVALLLRRLREVVRSGADGGLETLGIVKPVIAMMKGDAVSPSDLMKVDDFSLSVLIDAVAGGFANDDTARDLAQRIQARDLFKQIPVRSEEIVELTASPDRFQALQEAIQPYVPGPSKYYLVWDTVSFNMFSNDDEADALFVDESGEASPVSNHPSLRGYGATSEPIRRIFTVRGAIDSAIKAMRR
jgi:HD superfamily phosphohydrolase